ncbi:MAG: endonuclease III domain-containing protein [Alphaproteobacteria bacterium]
MYNNKAKNILALSLQLMEKYNGEVPHDRAALEALPGVGRKTANVILNVWWKKELSRGGWYVLRLAERLRFSDGKTPLTVEADLNKLPDEYKLYINHWLKYCSDAIFPKRKNRIAQIVIFCFLQL